MNYNVINKNSFSAYFAISFKKGGFNWDGLYRRTLNPPLIRWVRDIYFCLDVYITCRNELFIHVFFLIYFSVG